MIGVFMNIHEQKLEALLRTIDGKEEEKYNYFHILGKNYEL